MARGRIIFACFFFFFSPLKQGRKKQPFSVSFLEIRLQFNLQAKEDECPGRLSARRVSKGGSLRECSSM